MDIGLGDIGIDLVALRGWLITKGHCGRSNRAQLRTVSFLFLYMQLSETASIFEEDGDLSIIGFLQNSFMLQTAEMFLIQRH